MDLRMARGDEARALPTELTAELAEVAQAANEAINRDQPLAQELCRRELEIYRAAEEASGQRTHKGHALHNLGAAILADSAEQARTLFHAAFVEDVRTDSRELPDMSGSVARQTLAEMYGEPRSLLVRLEARARDTTGDPIELARAFETEEAPLPAYRGFRRGWRKLDQLGGIPPEELVFVAGAHALPDRILALRRAVIEVGLTPVVVIEFEEFADPYTKSETLLSRCGAVLFDVSFAAAGYTYELPMTNDRGVPRWAGYVSWSTDEPPYAWDMTKGLFQRMGLEPVAAVDTDQLRAEAVAWLRRQTGLISRPAPGLGTKPIIGGPVERTAAAAGTAYRGTFANGSNTDYSRFYPEAPQATTSGSSTPPDVPFDPTIPVPRYKFVDGMLVREKDAPDDGLMRVDVREPKE